MYSWYFFAFMGRLKTPQTAREGEKNIANAMIHSYDYRPNWTPLGPITYINKPVWLNLLWSI